MKRFPVVRKSKCGFVLLFPVILVLSLPACSPAGPTEIISPSPPDRTAVVLPPEHTSTSMPIPTPSHETAPTDQGAEAETPTTTPIVGPTDDPGTEASTQIPPKLCEDRAEFIADVSYPDGSLVQPGRRFQKTWRLRNAGTCTWTEGYSLAFHSGASMGTYSSILLGNNVPPGEVADLSIELSAPLLHGRYKSYWMLRDPAGFHFGFGSNANRPLWLDVVVGASVNPRCNVSQLPAESQISRVGLGVYDVAVSGTYAYAATRLGFSVFDVSDPANPSQLDTVRQGWGKVFDMVAREGYVYVGDAVLQVYDTSNLEAPELVGELFVTQQPHDMAIAGNYAYYLDSADGLQVIDITNPSQPVKVSHSAPISNARGLAVQGNYAFLGSRDIVAGREADLLKVFDLTDPTSPREVSSLEAPGIGVVDLLVSGEIAYVSVVVDAYDHDIWIVDVSDPNAPASLGIFEGVQIIWDMALRGACAFMINFEAEGFIALDVSDPLALREIGVSDLHGFPNTLTVEGGIVYIADSDEGLLLLPMIPLN